MNSGRKLSRKVEVIMSFYEQLSKVYDIVFSRSEGTVKFLSENVKQHDKVLDVACGTGTYTIALVEAGCVVTGIDLDPQMIDLAKEKTKSIKKQHGIQFLKGDMLQLKQLFLRETFDMVFCIGNSLVHLSDRESIQSILKDIYNLLCPGGEVILQIINYDRILDKQVDALPTIMDKDKGVIFIRKYRPSEDKEKVIFRTELLIQDHGIEEQYENEVPLVALRKNELSNMLEAAGFTISGVYGNFLKDIYNEDSYATVIRAKKHHSDI